jgi:hypothetical protein
MSDRIRIQTPSKGEAMQGQHITSTKKITASADSAPDTIRPIHYLEFFIHL